jgi:hypothetical protein
MAKTQLDRKNDRQRPHADRRHAAARERLKIIDGRGLRYYGWRRRAILEASAYAQSSAGVSDRTGQPDGAEVQVPG